MKNSNGGKSRKLQRNKEKWTDEKKKVQDLAEKQWKVRMTEGVGESKKE